MPDDSTLDPCERWEVQVRKGSLDLAILAILWSGRLYGLEIVRSLKEKSGLRVAEGTIYPILSRLQTDGLVESEWIEAETGHPRKYYELTGKGRERARALTGVWMRFVAGLSTLVEPVRASDDHCPEGGI